MNIYHWLQMSGNLYHNIILLDNNNLLLLNIIIF